MLNASSSSDCAGHDMTELSFQPNQAHLLPKGFNRRDQAPALSGQRPAREISVVPLVLVAAALFGTNVWIATRWQGQSERATLFAAFGAAGAPVFQWSTPVCRSASGSTSTVRPGRAEMLSLLSGN
jgi:hypothetical protein